MLAVPAYSSDSQEDCLALYILLGQCALYLGWCHGVA